MNSMLRVIRMALRGVVFSGAISNRWPFSVRKASGLSLEKPGDWNVPWTPGKMVGNCGGSPQITRFMELNGEREFVVYIKHTCAHRHAHFFYFVFIFLRAQVLRNAPSHDPLILFPSFNLEVDWLVRKSPFIAAGVRFGFTALWEFDPTNNYSAL